MTDYGDVVTPFFAVFHRLRPFTAPLSVTWEDIIDLIATCITVKIITMHSNYLIDCLSKKGEKHF